MTAPVDHQRLLGVDDGATTNLGDYPSGVGLDEHHVAGEGWGHQPACGLPAS
jgi:hypothetical protein